MEEITWRRLYHSSHRYQQATMISLTLSPMTSVWLMTPPLSSEPGYCLHSDHYRLAARHRLGILSFDDLRSKACTGCAQSRNKETPSLLEDPDHAHSCLYQEGTSVKLRHDLIKLVLAELARQCNYHVEVEPDFPPRLESHYNVSTGESTITPANQVDIRGDLLLIRDNTRQLIDVTVARPTSMTHLSQSETSINGAHLHPLIAATEAEKYKHRKYDQECSTHGWKLVCK